MNDYFRDLANRQNRSITTAQVHLYENARRYNMDELKDSIDKIKTYQVDLEGNPRFTLVNKEVKEKETTVIEVAKNEFDTRLLSLDVESNMRLSYHSGLLDELIESFSKLYDWMDSGSRIIKFTSDGHYVVIEPEEIKTTIEFISKLNRLPKEDKRE